MISDLVHEKFRSVYLKCYKCIGFENYLFKKFYYIVVFIYMVDTWESLRHSVLGKLCHAPLHHALCTQGTGNLHAFLINKNFTSSYTLENMFIQILLPKQLLSSKKITS